MQRKTLGRNMRTAKIRQTFGKMAKCRLNRWLISKVNGETNKKNSEFAQPHSCKNSPHSLIRASGSALNVHCNFVTILLLGLIYIWALRKKFTTRCYVVFSHTTSTIKQLLIYCHCYSLWKCQFKGNNEEMNYLQVLKQSTNTRKQCL